MTKSRSDSNKVKLSSGRVIEIKPLTWRQKRQLNREGVEFAKLDPKSDNDEVVEKVLRIALPELELDELPVGDVYNLFGKIIEVSFATEQEAKNSK